MRTIISILTLALATSCIVQVEEPEETRCILEGTYETGSTSTPECGGTEVFVQTVTRRELSCDRHEVTPENEAYTYCAPGDPSAGCEGFVANVNGCSYRVWITKL
jgi:hypothetical protein